MYRLVSNKGCFPENLAGLKVQGVKAAEILGHGGLGVYGLGFIGGDGRLAICWFKLRNNNNSLFYYASLGLLLEVFPQNPKH